MKKENDSSNEIKEQVSNEAKKDLFLGRFDKDKTTKFLLAVIAVLVVLIIIISVVKGISKGSSTKGVTKLLDTKSDSITCIDSDCNGFMAIEGDKLTKYKVVLFNVNGEKVADYKEVYDASKKATEIPYAVGKDFYLTSVANLEKLSESSYNMKNKKGKVLLNSKNKINILNNNLVYIDDSETSKITLYDKKGKAIYSNISDMNPYLFGKIIEVDVDGTYALLNEVGEKFLTDYSISKMVKDESDLYLYAIVRNEKDKVYYYFDLIKAQVVGDSFNSYTSSDETGTYIISKKENDKTVKYTLTKDGKQTKIEDTEETNETSDDLYKVFKDKVDKDAYAIYSRSLYSKDQENILVDNKKDKSIGIYNVKSNEFKELYKYNQEKSYFSSNVYKVTNQKDESAPIIKITCTYYCEKNESVVYDIKNNKELYSYEGDNYVTSYSEYENGYKVIGLSNTDDKYSVLNKDNKNLYSSKYSVLLVDSEMLFGDKPSYSAILYSSKENKALTEQTVSIVDDFKNILYKYNDDDNIYVLNKDGKEIIKVGRKDYFKAIDNYYVYMSDNKLNIYDIDKNKTNTYSLKENEKMNDASGSMINPYKDTIIINNSTDKYVKVINFKGKVLKKIDKVELSKLKRNDDEEKIFLIVKQTKDNNDKYGLYEVK